MKTFIYLFVLLFTIFSSTLAWTQVQTNGRNSSRLSYRDFYLPGPRIEAGISLGAANAMTDVAARTPDQQASMMDVYGRGLSPSISLYGRCRFTPAFALRTSASAVMIKGNDRWSPDMDVVNRGKSFSNNIFELAALGEWYMPKKYNRHKQDFRLNWLDLYVFAGLSGFYHNPQVKGPIIDEYDFEILTGDDIYSNFQVGVPFGVGMKWILGNQWTLGLDMNFRYTFFDYLDGFKRPYSSRNDFYFTSNLNIGYVINARDKNTNRVVNRYVFDGSLKKRKSGKVGR